MIPYLLYVALLLAVCWMFYKLLLQKETFYRLNRWVLLSCLVVSFALPIIHVPQRWKLVQPAAKLDVLTHVRITQDFDTLRINRATHQFVDNAQIRQAPPAAAAKTANTVLPARPVFHIKFSDITVWLMIIYWTGVIVLSLNLLIQLLVTLYKAYQKQPIIDGGYRIIDLTGDKIPCSFLNTIFINPEKYDWDTYNQIILHEKVHIRQLHSLDIFLAEMAIIFQWFNPFAWQLRKEIENNLEYLTDEEVLHADIEPSSYQMSLLKVSAPHLSLRITTNYNQSLLKKRITMMNAKKSNIHTLWKYFVLLPLFGGLACALNQPAVSKNLALKTVNPTQKPVVTDTPSFTESNGLIEGVWFATRKHDTITMEFKTTANNHTWNDGGNFAINEFSSIPVGKKGTFTVTRDAGSMILTGSYDGDEGVGHFKFTPDKKYVSYLATMESGKFDEHDVMSLFGVNVSKEYMRIVVEDGYANVKANDFAALKYFHITPAELYYWKHSGVQDIDLQSLIGIRYYKIDSTYVRSIQKMGFKDITFSQLLSLKHEDITPEYIKNMLQARQAIKRNDTSTSVQLSDIIYAKHEHLDSIYVRRITLAGYSLTDEEYSRFMINGITPESINEWKQMGYHFTANELLTLATFRVTPEFVNNFAEMGYKNMSFDEIMVLKNKDITPDYLKSIEILGYKNLPLNDLISFKAQNITPDYITGFSKLGFNNIPADDLIMLKVSDVTPEYVASMKQKGLESKDIKKYVTLKNSFKDSQ